MKDFYQILGVDSKADDVQIKAAYRRLAKENHPDLKPNDKVAESRFKEINEAYETLRDREKRARYDAERSGGGAFRWNNYSNTSWTHPADVNLEDIIHDIFPGGSRGRGFYSNARNRDIILGYTITLEEAFKGSEAEVKYNTPGRPTQEIKFKIPPGIQDGVKLRFQGKGEDTLTGVPPGDLYIRVNVAPHPLFVRMNFNLHTCVAVDYLDAILGCDQEIATIDGGQIKMRIPAGISPGQLLRAQGKGMMTPNGTRGDMMVEVLLKPEVLTEEQRKLIEAARNLRTKSA